MNWNLLRPIARAVFRRGVNKAKESGPRKDPDPGQGYSNANARGWLTDVLTHHWAESLEIDRAAQAAGYGMKAGDRVSRFAGQSQTIHNTGGGFVKGALMTLLAAGMFGPLGFLAAGGLSLWQNTKQQETVIAPEEYEIDLEVKDGKLVPTEVRPVDPE